MLSPARLLYQIHSMNSAINSSGIPPSALSVSLPHHRLRPERRPESRLARRAGLPSRPCPLRPAHSRARLALSIRSLITYSVLFSSDRGAPVDSSPTTLRRGAPVHLGVNEGSRRSDVAVSRGTLTAARFSRPPLFPASPPLSLPRPLFSSSSSLPLVHAFGL